MDILGFHVSFVFQDFESYLRTEVDLVEDDIKLVLDEYISSFITCELEPAIYTFENFSEALLKILQPEYDGYLNAFDIEYDDIAVKTDFYLRVGIIAIRVDEQSFFSNVRGFTAGSDNKHYNEYTS